MTIMEPYDLVSLRASNTADRLARQRANFAQIAEERRQLQEQMAILAQSDTDEALSQFADLRRRDNQLRVVERKFRPDFEAEEAKIAKFLAEVDAMKSAPRSPARGALGERNSRVITQDVKVAVAIRDQGKCVQCGSAEDIHYDHKIPWSRGGTNTVNNIQLLCGTCNRRKGATELTRVTGQMLRPLRRFAALVSGLACGLAPPSGPDNARRSGPVLVTFSRRSAHSARY